MLIDLTYKFHSNLSGGRTKYQSTGRSPFNKYVQPLNLLPLYVCINFFDADAQWNVYINRLLSIYKI